MQMHSCTMMVLFCVDILIPRDVSTLLGSTYKEGGGGGREREKYRKIKLIFKIISFWCSTPSEKHQVLMLQPSSG